jgi:NhaP-type Na+/H+ or K+/H+ antiporter
VFFTFYAFRLCFRKSTINVRELIFITYGGMIRGAIAFALVIRIPYDCPTEEECTAEKYYELQKSTCLIVVVITTLLFGSFMKFTQSVLLPPKAEVAHEEIPEENHIAPAETKIGDVPA